MKNAVRLISTASGSAARLAPIDGSAGRYMSMANGPMAVSRPRISALRRNAGRGEAEVDMGLVICWGRRAPRSEENTSELQSLMRISYAVFCLTKKKNQA